MKKTKSGIIANRPEDAYGQTVNRILEDVMDVPARPREVEDELGRLYVAIEEKDMDKAKYLLGCLQETIGTDPDLVRAGILIRRLEIPRE